jgi:hypothetical protein
MLGMGPPVLGIFAAKSPLRITSRFPAFRSSAAFVELNERAMTISPSMIMTFVVRDRVPLVYQHGHLIRWSALEELPAPSRWRQPA